MKIKLLLFNLALVFFLAGLLLGFVSDPALGASAVLLSSTLIAILYVVHLYDSLKKKQLITHTTITLGGLLFVLAVIYVHGFGTSIDFMFLGRLNWFSTLYALAGVTMIVLFHYFSYITAQENERAILSVAVSITSILALAGLSGYVGWLPVHGILIFYSWVFMMFFLLLFLIYLLRKEDQARKREYRMFLWLSLAMVGFWAYRFVAPPLIEHGLTKAIVDFGFVPIIILPIAIYTARKFHAFVIFAIYFICLDFYFLHLDHNLKYLSNVGINGCENYVQDSSYPVQSDPGIPMEELLKEPSQSELEKIAFEWQQREFKVISPLVVYEEIQANGDSIKVIAHRIDGNLHYGAIRIPKGLDIQKAPILMELEGGGGGIDVSKLATITDGKCSEARDRFISILPSYRGNVLRGRNFCFRSDGYPGDVWLGPAIDAITFLEVVKAHYDIPEARVLLDGVSRGATVSLIIGSLTEKADFIIATSTHTKFLDPYVFKNELVGRSFSRAFFTPKAPALEIRKRMIASSSFFFADQLPPFHLHQGTADHLNTVWHAQQLRQRLMNVGKDTISHKIFLYKGKGHGYDDNQIFCESMNNFLTTFAPRTSS